jgi:hypothetical protein
MVLPPDPSSLPVGCCCVAKIIRISYPVLLWFGLDRIGDRMFIVKPLPFVTTFIEALDETLEEAKPGWGLSRIQKAWLSFCILAILVTNSVCWAKFARASLGSYSLAALSWMFCHAKIPWEWILQMSVRVIVRRYGLTHGCLDIDDTDKKRAKVTRKIAYVHKLKDKASGGFIQGQCIVFLVLVTPKITFPVGFAFYRPDPAVSAWYKADKKLKKQGTPPQQRPPKPVRNETYPTKGELALRLVRQFKGEQPTLKIKSIHADALYGTEAFLDEASEIFDQTQVISQIRSNQNVRFRNRKLSVEEYFTRYPGTPQQITLRGGKQLTALIGSARLYVCAHHKKRFVIALKYEQEESYRYLIARDLTWRTIDIVQAHTLRWLVEVFIEDWKSHEGWGTLTKQTGPDGSSQSLILSLLVDHCLLLHPEQLARIENKLPAYTVGSLTHHIQVDCLFDFIRELLFADDPEETLNRLTQTLKSQVCTLNASKKHMVNRDLGRLESTPGLKYKATA